ncbi:hypothetical protein 3S11_50 [uncultured Caudovirales phage]|uniref:Uncharacterized protein n=1 Tax=uncultured Caudovirales phage TaxID=2100421 RepID=A0A2H4J123_9CAUD|nr:hypothetical protein [Pseudomonas luteola]ASN68675.1 hypothetical protein 3S11_50 [uncultured Caudovirales phage]QEU28878.1 hypothetical protein FOB45_14270 [Pseudomonas luteola]
MDLMKALADCKKTFESADRTLMEAQAYLAKREQSACKILDVWVVSTTSVGRQLAASLLVFAFRHGDISERVFDQYWARLNGLEVAA